MGAGKEPALSAYYLFQLRLARRLDRQKLTSPDEEVVDLESPEEDKHDEHLGDNNVLRFLRVDHHY